MQDVITADNIDDTRMASSSPSEEFIDSSDDEDDDEDIAIKKPIKKQTKGKAKGKSGKA